MGLPEDHTGQQPKETLQVGPSGRSLFEKIPPQWRQPAVAFLAFVLGVAAVGGAVLWRQARPEPQPIRVDEHAVELVLFDAALPRKHPSGQSEDSPLHVNGAVLLSGLVTSTVVEIDTPGHGLGVRAPALPVTVSPTGRFRSVRLEIIVRDCEAATRWAPGDRPFYISWREEDGKVHMDRAGDFDRSMATRLVRYVDAVCDEPLGVP